VTAAIALTKSLSATATLGRISSAYPDGRVYKGAWGNPTRIVYPRPTSERDAGGTYDGGLNGEYDKWLAGVPWYPCLGVMHGAFPYRVQISGETVDGSPADTGVQYAEYIEDHAAETPYLGFYHAGFTAPAGGTKVIAFTITVTDCLGTTDTYPVSLTVYAQDHASVLTHFRVVDTTAGVNGTGTWSSPLNIVSGAGSLYGTDWASTTHCPKTVIALYKDGSTIMPTGMTNMPGSDVATVNEILNGYFPRSHIGVYGATVTIDFTSNSHAFNTQAGGQVNDILIKNIKFANNSVAARNGINFGIATRCHVHDVRFDTFGAAAGGSNEAPIRTSGVGANNYDCTILRCSFDKPYAINAAGGNHYGAISVISWHRGLIDDVTVTNMNHNLANRHNGMIRIKHDSVDTEFRRITQVASVQVVLGSLLRLGTGGGIGATANKHVRALVRHCNLFSPSANSIETAEQGGTNNEEHSVQLHFNSLRGGVSVEVDATTTIENARQFLAYKNMVMNTAAGFSTLNTTTVPGESSQDVGNVKGVSGVLNADGTPTDPQYLGLVGHTVITV
jgi:hypothetical protein